LSSAAVIRLPWRSGRVSSAKTWKSTPFSCPR
jgi:hypothetical protein